MITQIKSLRSGTKNQILNPAIDYKALAAATSHTGHAGSAAEEVESVWAKIKAEHPVQMQILVKGLPVTLTANWSNSGKSVSYDGEISKQDLKEKFSLKAAATKQPYISIQNANLIVVSNGKNSYTNICPSLIEIL